MRISSFVKKLKSGEIKVWTSKDYCFYHKPFGYPDCYSMYPDEDITETENTEIEDYEWKKYPDLLVCIDNGHASTTTGKRTPWLSHGVDPQLELYEYDFNRKVANKLKEKLEKSGVNVFMVCPEVNRDIALTTRYKRANAEKEEHPDKKCLLVSIHANAYGMGTEWTTPRGWCAFTTKGKNNSDKLAECLYDAAEEIFIPKGLTIRKELSDGDRDWESNFTIIWGANMPAILTENFFYTNVDDVKYMLTDEAIEDIAEVHYKGIIKFAETHFKL